MKRTRSGIIINSELVHKCKKTYNLLNFKPHIGNRHVLIEKL